MIMRKVSFIIIVAMWMVALAVHAQNVVVVDASTQVVCTSTKKATVNYHRVYKLLNDHSKWASQFSETCSKYDKLSSFEAVVTDEAGKVIKTIKKGDLHRSDLSHELGSDLYTMYYDYTPPRYPVTIEFKWTSEMDKSVLTFPTFVPTETYDVQVDKATYSLEAPAEMHCRYAVLNSDIKVLKTIDGDVERFTAEVTNFKPTESEPLCESARYVLPMVYFAPSQFEFLGHAGNAATWHDFGLWIHSLRQGRDQLSPEAQATVRAMTDTCTSDHSRLAVLYKHLEQSTRYVSIQLGIGGMQPFDANDVCRTGFGDCKGLSNYMCAMLETVGIKSLYAIISTRNKTILNDFSSANQFNHAIAGAVIAGDTIWLECTNPKIPLGYVHDDIAGHQALLITPEGGKVVTLPTYSARDNSQTTTLSVALNADGTAAMHLKQRSANVQYEEHMSIVDMLERDKRTWVTTKFKSPSSQLGEMTITEDKTPFVTPTITIDAEAVTDRFATTMGSRLLVPVAALRESAKPRDMAATRKLAIELYGYHDTDSIIVTIPEGYAVEAMPSGVEVENELGLFKQKYDNHDNTVFIITERSFNGGTYPASDYSKYFELKTAIYQALKQKISLKHL